MPVPHQGYSDQPTTADELGFAPSAEALLSILSGTELADTPLTIGIFGPWGSGKTSLMRMLHERMDPANPIAPCLPIWFEAWRYAQSDALWRALLLSIVEELRRSLVEDEARLQAIMASTDEDANEEPSIEAVKSAATKLNHELDDLVASLYRNVEREEAGELEFDWPVAGKLATRLVVRASFAFLPVLAPLTKLVEAAQGKISEGENMAEIWDLFQRRRTLIYRDQVRSLDQFQMRLRSLVEQWIAGRGRRLVIFIDDLDRCLPEQAIGVLEAIKVFLDIHGCVFVLGVDREIIEHGIRVRYKEFALDADAAARADHAAAVFPVAGRDYMEKIVQVPFELPPLERDAIRRFLNTRLRGMDELEEVAASQVATVMTTGLLPNPRKVKRTFNTFRLQLALDQAQANPASPALIAKLVVIQSSFPSVYEHIVGSPPVLRELEKRARDLGGDVPEVLKQATNDLPLLNDMLFESPFFAQLPDEQLSNLVFRTRTT
jgi:hypothetical protein